MHEALITFDFGPKAKAWITSALKLPKFADWLNKILQGIFWLKLLIFFIKQSFILVLELWHIFHVESSKARQSFLKAQKLLKLFSNNFPFTRIYVWVQMWFQHFMSCWFIPIWRPAKKTAYSEGTLLSSLISKNQLTSSFCTLICWSSKESILLHRTVMKTLFR